jgi:peptidyl-prolyl cis-trans isomerase D
VLRQEAGRLGLTVTEDAIREQLRKIPSFQASGGFSPGLYRETLRSQGLTPSAFEDSVRQDLLEAQLADIVRRGSHVSDEEAWQDYQRENRKMTLSYVAVDSQPFEKEVTVDEEALTKFYDSKQESYRRPPSVKVRYIAYKVADIADKIEVSDVDLNEYYDLNKNSEFQSEEQIGARHILKAVAAAGDENAKKAAREAIEAVKKKLDAGGNFEELAKAESDDSGSAVKGGDLGLFSHGKMVPAFDKAAFALEVGQTSDIVETDFGYHIIRVYEKKPAGVAPFDEVKDKVRKTLATQKAVDRAFDDSAEDAVKISEGAKLDDIAKQRGSKVEETPMFSQGDVVPGVGPAPSFVEAAFALVTPGDVSQPIKVGGDYYLLALSERKESAIPPLSEIHDQVASEYRAGQALDLARKHADEMLAAVKSGTPLAQVAEQNHLDVKKAEDVSASGNYVKDLGPVPGLSEVAFAVAKDGEPLSRSFVAGSKACIFQRDIVTEPSKDDFESVKPERIKSLETARQQEAMSEFTRSLKQKEQISYDLAQIRPLLGETATSLE